MTSFPATTAAGITDSTATGQALVTAASASAAKTTIGLSNVTNVDTTNASNISSGTLPAARLNGSTLTSLTIGTLTGTTATIGGVNLAATYSTVNDGFAVRSSGTTQGTGYAIEMNTNASLPRFDFVVNGSYIGQASCNATSIIFKNNLNNSGTIAFSTQSSSAYADRLLIANDGFATFSAGGQFAAPVRPGVYTIGTLPTAGTAGRIAYATNARVSGEGSGAGTGSLVTDTGSVWRIAGTNTTAAA